jgi:hypothetical protein
MIYGWDISTSIIGLSLFDDGGVLIRTLYLDLRKEDGQLAKADAFWAWVKSVGVNNDAKNFHFIEERLGGFAGGRTSAQVLMKLAQFNAICSYILWTHNPGPYRQITYLHPSTWKAILKKEGLFIPKGADKKTITLAFVRKKEPSFTVDLNRNDKVQPWCYDMADAWCLGRAGFLTFQKICTERENSPPSEEP